MEEKLSYSQAIGMRIKNRRKEITPKMTQKDLANALQVTQSRVSQYESGVDVARNGTLQKIANVLNCSVAYLLGYTEDPNKEIALSEIMRTTINAAKEKYDKYYTFLKLLGFEECYIMPDDEDLISHIKDEPSFAMGEDFCKSHLLISDIFAKNGYIVPAKKWSEVKMKIMKESQQSIYDCLKSCYCVSTDSDQEQ